MMGRSELQGGCFQSRSLTLQGRGTLVVEYSKGDECLSPLCALEIPSKFIMILIPLFKCSHRSDSSG